MEVYKINSSLSLQDVFNLVLKAQGRVLYFVFASNSRLLQLRPLRLLKRVEREAGKKIIVVNPHEEIRDLVEAAGLSFETGLPTSRNYGPQRTGRARSSDIGVVEHLRPVPPKSVKSTAKPVAASPSPAVWVAKHDKNVRAIPKHPKKRSWMFFSLSLLVIIAAGVVAANFVLQKAKVTVFASAETSKASSDILIDSTQVSDLSVARLHGDIINKELSATKSFPATGSSTGGAKAAGSVNLQSSYRTTITLKNTTTYLVGPDGQRFRFIQTVTGLQPGKPQIISITSETGGAANNLSAGTKLEVYNAVLGHLPDVLYATVGAGGLTGGSTDSTPVISEQDLTKAKDDLQNDLISQLSQTAGVDKLVIRDLVKIQIIKEEKTVKAGDAVANFNYGLTGDLTALVVNKNELKQYLSDQLKKNLALDQSLAEVEEASFAYDVRSWNQTQGITAVNISYAGKVYPKFDQMALSTLLSGKSADQIKDLLLEKPEISAVKVDLSPFWLKKTPSSAGRIQIQTEYK